MRRNLQVDQLDGLVRGAHLATMATYRANGTVLLSPVWHEWVDDGFNVVTYVDDIKTRHLRRDPRVGLVLAEDSTPYRGIEVTTRAKLLEDGGNTVLKRIAIRYLGAERGSAYARAAAQQLLLLVRIEPGHLRAWDFADEF